LCTDDSLLCNFFLEGGGHSSGPLARVDSVSFYSSGADSLKSKAWERSGAKLVAARIKDSVDMSMSLSLQDLEFLGGGHSPNPKAEGRDPFDMHDDENASSNGFGSSKKLALPPHQCSISSSLNTPSKDRGETHYYGPSGAYEIVNARPGELQSTNIEALINSENFPPSSVILNATSSNIANAPSPSNNIPVMDTPSKKVIFNLHENLVNTPSPKNSITGTPKSILKDTGGGVSSSEAAACISPVKVDSNI
jgi:hypothetical protein